ncbi:helix-turn-helix domain-containing protein [Legionella tucsonensis]
MESGAHYVLLCAEGKSAPEIARHLNRNIIMVRLWLNRYIQDGVEGLRTRKPPGRPEQKAPIIETQLEELLHQSPQDYGYQVTGWQINVLKDWFARQGFHVVIIR